MSFSVVDCREEEFVDTCWICFHVGIEWPRVHRIGSRVTCICSFGLSAINIT